MISAHHMFTSLSQMGEGVVAGVDLAPGGWSSGSALSCQLGSVSQFPCLGGIHHERFVGAPGETEGIKTEQAPSF